MRAVTFDFADHHGISQLDLCDVVWSYSREACVNSPTNSRAIVGKRQGRKTMWQPTITDASEATPKQLESYNISCGICRLKETCAHNVPSGPYYVAGAILWPDPKVHLDHPQNDLHHNDTLKEAQRPVLNPTTDHAIDLRARNREELIAKRVMAIRTLSQSALFGLTVDQQRIVAESIAEATDNPNQSLSSIRFGFSDSEIIAALGSNPSAEELEAIEPYRAARKV